MSNPTDGQLMRQIRERRREALETLYDRHIRLVYSYALRMAGEEALAREIAQTVFTRLWTTRAEYDAEKGAFAAWLVTITRNIAVDVLRRERRHRSPLSMEALIGRPGETRPEDPEPALLLKAERAAVATAARKLSEPQRRVVELLYWRGYTLQEIADLGGEPVGTVKSRLHQALKTLRRSLHGLREGR